jgi:hypothetical protein
VQDESDGVHVRKISRDFFEKKISAKFLSIKVVYNIRGERQGVLQYDQT